MAYDLYLLFYFMKYKEKIMPQMDNEFFLVYFSCISTLLIYFMIDDNIGESFIALNVRYHVYSYYKNAKNVFHLESIILKNLVLKKLTNFVRHKKMGG